MTAPYDLGVRSEWVVDVATGRIHRWVPRSCATGNGSETLIGGREEGEVTAMSDDKERDQARKDLNPIEDIKGAIRYINHPLRPNTQIVRRCHLRAPPRRGTDHRPWSLSS